MVVMGYVHEKTAYERYGISPLPQAVVDQVRVALVFGSLCPLNIMNTEDERVMLIDFDWCGVHEEGT
ncbi:hypothetical protein BJV74DRAFT_868965 [Russula compacta]|nr:hypothetical protein BJV74DRAFT_868965 [Russula compacta]